MGRTLALLAAMTLSAPAFAHGGGLNSQGCHNNRKTGDYHCHRSGYSTPARPSGARTLYSPPERAESPKIDSDAARHSKNSDSAAPAADDTVLAAEALLRALGHDPGQVDGILDASTSAAIREFEANNGIPMSGKFTKALLPLLGRAASEKRNR